MKSIVSAKGAVAGAKVALFFPDKCHKPSPFDIDTILYVRENGNIKTKKYGNFRVEDLSVPLWRNSNMVLHPMADKTLGFGLVECVLVSDTVNEASVEAAKDVWKAFENKEKVEEKKRKEAADKKSKDAWAKWGPVFRAARKVKTTNGTFKLIDVAPVVIPGKTIQFGVLLMVKTIDRTMVLGECLKGYNDEPIKWVMEITCLANNSIDYMSGYHFNHSLTSPDTETTLWRRLADVMGGGK